MLGSCSEQYLVSGSSNVEGLEGKMLYLRVFKDDDMCAIVMPVVIEQGDVCVQIDENTQSATGTPLNDSLTSFIQKKLQIDARMAELPHLESQMIMNGIDHDQILIELGQQAHELEIENDRLITRFIRSNYNNVLGPGVFMIMTSSLEYPILNPQIEEIISQAPPYFMNHPYVREYIKKAESNMEKLRQY